MSLPILHDNGEVSLKDEPVGKWSRLPVGPGYLYECKCGTTVQRFGHRDLREKVGIHLAGPQHRGEATDGGL